MASPSDHVGPGVDWDAMYRAGDMPWDRGEAHPALLWWLRGNSPTGRILVPGCGRGHDVRALAGSGAQVIGLDLSPRAIEAARSEPLSGREEFVVGNFFDTPKDWTAAFDAIFEHTCFCAIDPSMRQDYASSAAHLLTPGGILLAIFFLDPGSDDGPPFGCTVKELDRLFGKDFETVREVRDLPTYPGREGRELLRVLRRKS